MTEYNPENESMESMMDEIEKSMKKIRKGDIVEGTIILVNESEIVVNLGSATDGVIPIEELDDDIEDLTSVYNEGDKIKVFVIKKEDAEGNILLSKKRADYIGVWDEFESSKNGSLTFKVKVKETTKGGVIANIKGVKGFIPASQISLNYVEDTEEFINEELEVQVIEYEQEKQKLILSAKAVLLKKREKQGKILFDSLSEGQVYTGKVTRLADFGAFVDIGGADGLIHVSELSWKRIKHPSEIVNVNDIVEVTVLKVDKESKRISLRLNDVQDNPWENISNYYNVNDVVKGKVIRLTSFGAFVELESGVDGLVHISEISEDRISKAADVLSINQEINVLILSIDEENNNISLSIKALDKQEDVDVSEFLDETNNETTIGSLFKDKFKKLKF